MIRPRTKRKHSYLRPNARKSRNADPRSLRYMEFVKQFPCLITYKEKWLLALRLDIVGLMRDPHWFGGYFPPSEAAHIGGNAAAKASNWSCIPLSPWWHEGESDTEKNEHCEHGLKAGFGPFHGIDIPAVQVALRQAFEEWEKEQ